jgi:ABC-type transport system involved in cytochrome c biogenesis permease component
VTFLPIAQRELRIASRKPPSWRLRWVFAGVTLITWFLLLAASRRSMPIAEKGKMLFIAIGLLALAFSLFAGLFQTSDYLSEEKREGTLGLLFLTPLKGYDVVLGKLIVTSLHAFYGQVMFGTAGGHARST